MTRLVNRRTILRGMLRGAAVTVGIPFLECFLNSNGTAMADGRPMPIRFGTWFWGLGMNKQIFIPKKVGNNYDLPEELESIRPVKKYINVYNNYRAITDGNPNLCHYTGWVILRCGRPPSDKQSVPNESIDVSVADAIGGGTRFTSLEMAATGNPKDSFSFRSIDAVNPPEVSPLKFYKRVFGPEFQDPNSPNFSPDPILMLRKSVLSAVREDSVKLEKKLGSADKMRLDEYFTSLRSLEQRLELQLQKPPPTKACHIPGAPADVPVGLEWDLVAERHNLMTDILVAALACNQTKVFNMVYSESFAATIKKGVPSNHHAITHEEAMNEHGYQTLHSWFVRRAMESWAYFVSALASVREGERTLLDNTLVFAHSDQELAKLHTIEGIPMMTAGRAGGRLRSGIHADGRNEDVATQVGLTIMRAMGMDVYEWGKGSMRTSKVVDGILT